MKKKLKAISAIMIFTCALAAFSGCAGCKKNNPPKRNEKPLAGPVIKPTTLRESPPPNGGIIKWRKFEKAAFDMAAKEKKPVLLYLAPAWCESCAVLDNGVFNNKDVESAISKGFIPVRVDPDERPDAAMLCDGKYAGLLYCLYPDGIFHIAQSHKTDEERTKHFLTLLKDYSEFLKKLPGMDLEIPNRFTVPRKSMPPIVPKDTASRLTELITGPFLFPRVNIYVSPGIYERRRFSENRPFILIDELLLLKKTGQWSDPEKIADRNLMQLPNIYDKTWGGFYRSEPITTGEGPLSEKLLSANVAAIETLLGAWQSTSDNKYRELAETTQNYIAEFLTNPSGDGFYNAQGSAVAAKGKIIEGKDYYALSKNEREAIGIPARDKTLYTGTNARAVSAYLALYTNLGWETSLQTAEAVLENIWKTGYTISKGVMHKFGDKPAGPYLLSDQVSVLRALLDAYQSTANNSYLDRAAQLAADINKNFADAGTGAFFFTTADNDINQIFKPRSYALLGDDAALAECYWRLTYYTGNESWNKTGQGALAAYSSTWTSWPLPDTAEYARAAYLSTLHPLQMVILGGKDDPRTHALLLAALQLYEPRKVVFALDVANAADKKRLSLLPYSPHPEPTLFACVETACARPITDPKTVQERMTKFTEKFMAGGKPGANAIHPIR